MEFVYTLTGIHGLGVTNLSTTLFTRTIPIPTQKDYYYTGQTVIIVDEANILEGNHQAARREQKTRRDIRSYILR